MQMNIRRFIDATKFWDKRFSAHREETQRTNRNIFRSSYLTQFHLCGPLCILRGSLWPMLFDLTE
jgi:hypothetical protein